MNYLVRQASETSHRWTRIPTDKKPRFVRFSIRLYLRNLWLTPSLTLDSHGRSHRYGIEQFAHVVVLQCDAAPGPITARAVAVDINVAAELCVLRWASLRIQCSHDRIILRSVDKAIAQSAFSMARIWIAYAE